MNCSTKLGQICVRCNPCTIFKNSPKKFSEIFPFSLVVLPGSFTEHIASAESTKAGIKRDVRYRKYSKIVLWKPAKISGCFDKLNLDSLLKLESVPSKKKTDEILKLQILTFYNQNNYLRSIT